MMQSGAGVAVMPHRETLRSHAVAVRCAGARIVPPCVANDPAHALDGHAVEVAVRCAAGGQAAVQGVQEHAAVVLVPAAPVLPAVA